MPYPPHEQAIRGIRRDSAGRLSSTDETIYAPSSVLRRGNLSPADGTESGQVMSYIGWGKFIVMHRIRSLRPSWDMRKDGLTWSGLFAMAISEAGTSPR